MESLHAIMKPFGEIATRLIRLILKTLLNSIVCFLHFCQAYTYDRLIFEVALFLGFYGIPNYIFFILNYRSPYALQKSSSRSWSPQNHTSQNSEFKTRSCVFTDSGMFPFHGSYRGSGKFIAYFESKDMWIHRHFQMRRQLLTQIPFANLQLPKHFL